jgi:hypothetical protein
MDPTATLGSLLEACLDSDREQAIEAVDALREWIRRGGFLPPAEGVLAVCAAIASRS